MPKRRTMLAAAAVTLCAAVPAAAQQDLFSRLDRNRDGILSSQELQSDLAREGNWIAVDRDRDGNIRRSEFGTVASAPRQAGSAAGATLPGPRQPARASGRP